MATLMDDEIVFSAVWKEAEEPVDWRGIFRREFRRPLCCWSWLCWPPFRRHFCWRFCSVWRGSSSFGSRTGRAGGNCSETFDESVASSTVTLLPKKKPFSASTSTNMEPIWMWSLAVIWAPATCGGRSLFELIATNWSHSMMSVDFKSLAWDTWKKTFE